MLLHFFLNFANMYKLYLSETCHIQEEQNTVCSTDLSTCEASTGSSALLTSRNVVAHPTSLNVGKAELLLVQSSVNHRGTRCWQPAQLVDSPHSAD